MKLLWVLPLLCPFGTRPDDYSGVYSGVWRTRDRFESKWRLYRFVQTGSRISGHHLILGAVVFEAEGEGRSFKGGIWLKPYDRSKRAYVGVSKWYKPPKSYEIEFSEDGNSAEAEWHGKKWRYKDGTPTCTDAPDD